jgi:hypothetical protein
MTIGLPITFVYRVIVIAGLDPAIQVLCRLQIFAVPRWRRGNMDTRVKPARPSGLGGHRNQPFIPVTLWRLASSEARLRRAPTTG